MCCGNSARGLQDDPLCRPSARRCPPEPPRARPQAPLQARGSRGAQPVPCGSEWMQPGTCPCGVASHNKKKVTPEWQVTPDEQNFQGSAGVFPHLDALARSCGQEHNHSQSWQSTNPLEGAELSPVCSPALGPGEASTSCSNLPTCYAPPGVLSHLPLTGEMKGSPSSQGAWLQVKERILHNPDSVSELQARKTWLSTWLSLHARYFPLRTKQAC